MKGTKANARAPETPQHQLISELMLKAITVRPTVMKAVVTAAIITISGL